MKVKIKHIIAITAIAMLTASGASAQEYRFDAGPMLGISGYLGDVNDGNMYKHVGFAGGALFRYNYNSRWAFKAAIGYAKLSGNSADVDRKFPAGQHYEFSSSVYDLNLMAEFNFLNYGIGPKYMKYKRISPYMTLGLGVVGAGGDGSGVTMVLPMGIGVKYKVKPRWNIGAEFTMRKAFGDKLDGLSDLNGEKHSFAKNTDWYSMLLLTVTYEFGKRCVKCHYVE